MLEQRTHSNPLVSADDELKEVNPYKQIDSYKIYGRTQQGETQHE